MNRQSYSAKVELQLAVQGVVLSLSHVGPSGLVVREDCPAFPPGAAELRVTVDDDCSVRGVYLPHGIAGPGQPIAFF